MKITRIYCTHIETGEIVQAIKIKRLMGVRYIVFWVDDSDPIIYTATDFLEKFSCKVTRGTFIDT